jgi:hypothetical protein
MLPELNSSASCLARALCVGCVDWADLRLVPGGTCRKVEGWCSLDRVADDSADSIVCG